MGSIASHAFWDGYTLFGGEFTILSKPIEMLPRLNTWSSPFGTEILLDRSMMMSSTSPLNNELPPMRVSKGRPLRLVVADDDSECRQRMRNLLAAEPDAHIVAECTRWEEVLNALRAHRPDLVLFDPHTAGANPFDMLAPLPPGSLPLVIFITAQDQYALKAFEARAFDYLLKPFNPERFHRMIVRARIDVARVREEDSLTSRHTNFVAPVRRIPGERLIVKSRGGAIFLEFDEIDWIEAAANYVSIHTASQVYRLREPIGHIERRIPGHYFLRIHRSIIVNAAKIKEVYPCNSGEYMVRLKSGKELPCSRHYNSAIRTLLHDTEPDHGEDYEP